MNITRFRYWLTEYKEMVYPKRHDNTRLIHWYSGSLCVADRNGVNFTIDSYSKKMQHTGLIVSEGKDLYENDIIKLPSGKLFFSDNLVKYHFVLDGIDLKSVELIGNTFEDLIAE